MSRSAGRHEEADTSSRRRFRVGLRLARHRPANEKGERDQKGKMLEPAELERASSIDADCLHGRQPIEDISNASIGCDTAGAARQVPMWERVRVGHVDPLEGLCVAQSSREGASRIPPNDIPFCNRCAGHAATANRPALGRASRLERAEYMRHTRLPSAEVRFGSRTERGMADADIPAAQIRVFEGIEAD